MEITNQIITYKQIREGFVIERDDAGIAAYDVTPERIKTFLSNPFLKDDSKCMVLLSRVDGVVRGVTSMFPTLTKIGEELVESVGGSALIVQDEYQQYALGTELVLYPMVYENNKFLLYSGFSNDGLSLYKAMRFCMFTMPKMVLPISPRLIFERYGLKGLWQELATFGAKCVITPYIAIRKMASCGLKRKYRVAKLDIVPSWVDDIVLNDGHKYTEYHNQAWFQWCIDNGFMSNPRECQAFFAIYKEDKPVGFYMVKDRLRIMQGIKEHKMVFRSIVEWGTEDENELSEYDIYRLAMLNLPKDVKMLQVASDNESVIKELKKLCFFHHGDVNTACRDLTHKYKDYKDKNLWRLRIGYNDVNFGI